MTGPVSKRLRIRSKNAGPFAITVDIFCPDNSTFVRVCNKLEISVVAALYAVPVDTVRRYEVSALNVLKFSFTRPVVQGSRFDRDMHGAQFAVLLEELGRL